MSALRFWIARKVDAWIRNPILTVCWSTVRKGIIGLILDVNLELFAHVYFENEIETDLITDFTSTIATFISKLPCNTITSTLGVP